MSKQTSKVVWNWKETEVKPVSARSSRARYWVQFAIMVVIGGILYGGFGHRTVAGIVWGLSALLLSGILFFDSVLRGFDKMGRFLARVVGTGLTWILLTPFFYIVFGPARLLMKICGKDPMRRKRDTQAKSYWVDHPKLDIKSRYQKQF